SVATGPEGTEPAMCGIVGIVSARDAPPPSREAVERAVVALHHRGPDGSGTHAEGPVVLGHTRLSIIDVEGGAQPIANEDGSVLTVYNGEIWNHEALRHELVRAGHVFRTRCDSEVLVHGWEEWGEGMLERISGMFAFALWDARTEHLLLARDRVGKKPLFVKRTPRGVAFGSDARSVLLATESRPEIDETALASFLFQRYVVAPQTMFRGVEQLEPGHLMVYDRRQVEARPYWQLEVGEPEELSTDELRRLLREAVGARLMS